MNDVLYRIRIVFQNSKLNQTEIGKKLNKTSQYVWKLLNDDSANPSSSVIKDICREFSVNEEWLQSGIGDMYILPQDKLTAYVAGIVSGDDEFTKDLIMAYMELDDVSKEALRKLADKMVEKRKEKEKA